MRLKTCKLTLPNANWLDEFLLRPKSLSRAGHSVTLSLSLSLSFAFVQRCSLGTDGKVLAKHSCFLAGGMGQLSEGRNWRETHKTHTDTHTHNDTHTHTVSPAPVDLGASKTSVESVVVVAAAFVITLLCCRCLLIFVLWSVCCCCGCCCRCQKLWIRKS